MRGSGRGRVVVATPVTTVLVLVLVLVLVQQVGVGMARAIVQAVRMVLTGFGTVLRVPRARGQAKNEGAHQPVVWRRVTVASADCRGTRSQSQVAGCMVVHVSA